MSIIMKRACICPGFTDVGDITVGDISYGDFVESIPDGVRIITGSLKRSSPDYVIHEAGSKNIGMGFEYAIYIHLLTVPTLKFMVFGRAIDQILYICRKVSEFHSACYQVTAPFYTIIGVWYSCDSEKMLPIRMQEALIRREISVCAPESCCGDTISPSQLFMHITAHWNQVTALGQGVSKNWEGKNYIPARDTSLRAIMTHITCEYEKGRAQIMTWLNTWDALVACEHLSDIFTQSYRIIGVGSRCKGDVAEDTLRYYLTNTPKELDDAVKFDTEKNSNNGNTIILWGFWFFIPSKGTTLKFIEYQNETL